jgi:hypothetical protein
MPIVAAGLAPLAALLFILAWPSAAAPQLASPAPRTSIGSVVVPARPAVVFAALGDPSAWPVLLSDVTRVERTENDPGSWRVLSKLMGHWHVVEMTLTRDALVHFHVSDAGPGGALDVDIALAPASAGEATRVSYTMRTVLPLGLGAVVDDEIVRRGREQKILRDLTDIERHFSGGKHAIP